MEFITSCVTGSLNCTYNNSEFWVEKQYWINVGVLLILLCSCIHCWTNVTYLLIASLTIFNMYSEVQLDRHCCFFGLLTLMIAVQTYCQYGLYTESFKVTVIKYQRTQSLTLF